MINIPRISMKQNSTYSLSIDSAKYTSGSDFHPDDIFLGSKDGNTELVLSWLRYWRANWWEGLYRRVLVRCTRWNRFHRNTWSFSMWNFEIFYLSFNFENKIIENLHPICMKNLSVRFRSSLNKMCLEWVDWSPEKVSSKSVVLKIDILIFVFFMIIISKNIKFEFFIGKSIHL